MRRLTHLMWLAIVLSFLFTTVCPAFGIDKEEFIKQARKSYYNLPNAGLKEFRCEVTPDLDATFKALKTDQVGRDQVLPILRKTHFQLVVGPQGASTVSHQSEIAPPNEQVAERVREAISGMEQLLTGFLQTWSQFMINVPIPDEADGYQSENLGDRYRLAMKAGTTEAAIVLGNDSQIIEVEATTAEFSGTVQPKFTPTTGGLILASYTATVKTQSANAQKLAVKIDYKDVEKLTLPSRVVVILDLPSGAAEFSFDFTNYKIKKS